MIIENPKPISNLIIKKYGYKNIIEIGTRRGDWSISLLEEFDDIKITCIDLWPTEYHNNISSLAGETYEQNEENYNIAMSKFAPFIDRVKVIRKYSLDASDDLLDNSYDMIFIDATHTYSALMCDVTLFWPKLKIGGIMCGHDCSILFDNGGMINAINELFGSNILINSIYTDWYHLKESEYLSNINRNIESVISPTWI